MKLLGKILIVVLLIAFLAGCGTAAPVTTEEPAAVEVEAPQAEEDAAEAPALTPKEEWLKANQLGSYYSDTQDWAAIEEAAKAEGKVVVYANSSKIAKAAESGRRSILILPSKDTI